MLKSLYSGVSGLQSHQVAMDVESNNIANVNTTGFKYSRANFSDLLAQTSSIATAPQGDLGGKNAVQIGLGSTVNSMTRIFSQGSIQNSDKNTDVAIQGDGFFIISPDGGNTYKYTRAGDFKFDAGGNFVDNNGFVAQGWIRDDVTGKVDSTAPIKNITIAPGLTTPASPTQDVVLKANLNSGPLVKSFSSAYEVPSGTPPSKAVPAVYTGDALDEAGNPIDSGNLGVMFNEVGEAFSLQTGQGIWASFLSSQLAGTTPVAAGAAELDITFTLDNGTTKQITTTGGVSTDSAAQNANRYVSAINAQTSLTGVTAVYNATTNRINLTNDNSNPNASHNINISAVGNTNSGIVAGTDVTAYKYQYNPTGSIAIAGADKTFTSISDLRYAMEVQARAVGDHDGVATDTTFTVTDSVTGADDGLTFTLGGVTVTVPDSGVPGNLAAANGAAYALAINNAAIPGITATFADPTLTITNANASDAALITGADAGMTGFTPSTTTTILAAAGDGTLNENNIEISVNAQGKFEISNPGGSADGDYDMNLKITAFSATGITENTKFTTNMTALNAVLPSGSSGRAFSQSFNAATHSSSIDIYDSLGSKHTVRIELRKTALDATTGSTWSMKISVPLPGSIDTVAPTNEKLGQIRFNNDGSLATYNPPNISFSGNNGSAPDQQVKLSFGTANAFDGMTSFDSYSSTSGISQDGFTGGDLVGIRIDQSGTVVGSFSNGRSFGLAQIAMAKFTNNEGLASEGGNVYIQTANSGDPIIGTAATSGRGFIQSSALEASNVDLSRALTQLIIIQRGYQANGKTITTSDQLLQTLIGLSSKSKESPN
ncbi:flagellar hook protein FlgE [Epsilonproteobacteria bacterium SCGC AD-308-O04]|nr:flagellar hook protein FlgE [Epsilonproteobacteria bacterium SCGC AD-308-O04]